MRISLTIPTRHDPICPICLNPLAAYAITFWDGVAFCPACAAAVSEGLLDESNRTILYRLNKADVTTRFGLYLWTPRRKPTLAAHLLTPAEHRDYFRPAPKPRHPVPGSCPVGLSSSPRPCRTGPAPSAPADVGREKPAKNEIHRKSHLAHVARLLLPLASTLILSCV